MGATGPAPEHAALSPPHPDTAMQTPAPARRLPPPRPLPDEVPRGCAWYDSSYELQRGLQVDELAEPAALAQLPLSWWLAWAGEPAPLSVG